MALTQIRGEQIRDGIVKNSHIAADAAIAYSKLDLAGQIVASDLNNDGSVEDAALDSKLITLWDMVQGTQTGTGSSVAVTTEVLASAATDGPQTGLTAKGVLLTGTGTNGAGTTNYRVQIRNAATGEPIADGTDEDPGLASNAGEVYAELRHDGTDYTLFFFDSNDQAYTFASDTQIDFMFLEVYSYLTAPAKGFIAGVGFADVVGIQGSHNHHDLYYTQTDLNGGQLDNRYYTETELDGGQLDNRYYTETELNPLAATTGDNVLDARYYRESELGSTASGDSGALLVGVDAAAVSGLDATTVQGALVELQGDINDITSGTINIDHSFDDAYDDGSVVTVDNTNVDFQLADTKTFQVSDSIGSGILSVTALSGGDTLTVTAATSITGNTDITGTFDVTGATTLDATTIAGTLGQSGGSVTLNAGANAVDVDGGTITVDGSSIAIASTGALTLKDQFLSAALPLAQANAAGLVSEFAYDAQTDFDWSTRDIGTTAPTSLIAAVNVNREDLYEYVELLGTQGAAVGTAAGANLIGVDGIESVVPTGHSLGEDSNLQEMLEGIASSGGGSCKHFDNVAAFIAAKEGGEYFNVDTQVYFEDIERQARVYTQSTSAIEGTDWDYTHSTARPLAGPAYILNPASMTVDTDGVLTLDGATDVVIASAGNVSLQGIDVTEVGETSLDTVATSFVGAINELEENHNTLVTDLADYTDGSAGADMIGVTGITGILPEGGTVGADATLQAMLEGIAKSAGGVKTFADESAFTTAKAAGDYLPVDTMVFLVDTNRFAIVQVEGTGVSEGTDFDYLWDASNPMGGASFNVSAPVSIIGNTDVTGTFDVVGASTLDAVTMEGNFAQSSGTVVLNATDVDIDAPAIAIDGALTATGATDDNMVITTTGTGQVLVNSETEIDLNAPLVDIHGSVVIESAYQLSVDQINITSVDPSDFATITGQRTGIPFTGNLLSNPGFEAGAGGDADSWTEGTFSGRTQVEKYYDNYSYQYLDGGSHSGSVTPIATQAITGLNVTSHIASLWFKGTTASSIEVVVNGGTPATIVPVATTNTAWTRYTVDVTPGAADGDVVFQVGAGSALDTNSFYLDALQLEEGTGAATDFFSTYQSELIMRIGNNAEDKISFQSQAPDGGTISELMAIDNSTVTIYGDLVVEGTTTTVNSEEMLVADNKLVLNDGQTSGLLDAFLEVDRGSDANVAIKWNETLDQWELSNDGSTFVTIATTGGSGALSMDTAYDGGSSVTVDNTNVDFTMSAGKSFILADGTDASKFVVSAGSGLDSVKIDTTGGVDIDTDAGINIADNSGSYIELDASGNATIDGVTSAVLSTSNGIAQVISSNGKTSIFAGSNASDAIAIETSAGGIDVNAETSFTVDASGISLDSDAASNFTTTGADLTLSTITSGNVAINSVGAVDVDASTVTVDAASIGTTGVLTQTGATQIIGAMDFDGAIDHDGASFNSTVTGDFGVSAATITTAGAFTQTGAFEVVGSSTLDATTIEGALSQSGGNATLDATGYAASITGDTIALNGVTTQTGAFEVVGASTLDAVTIAGNLGQSGGSVVLNAGANVVDIDGGAVTVNGSSVALASTGALTLKDQYLTAGIAISESGTTGLSGFTATSIVGALNEAKAAAEGANTFDEIYDGESATTRIVTVDDGNVRFDLTDTNSFTVADSAGTTLVSVDALAIGDVLDVNANVDIDGTTFDVNATGTSASAVKVLSAGGVDIDSAEGVNISDDSGSSFILGGDGSINAEAAAGESLAMSVNSGALMYMDSNIEFSAPTVDINGILDVDGASATIDTTGAFSIDGAAASNVTTTGANLTLSTATSGDVIVSSAGNVDVDGGAITIDGTAASNFTVTGNSLTLGTATAGNVTVTSAGEFYLKDSRTTLIPLSDVSNTSLPGDSTSILGALKTAYEKSIDMGYEEKTVASADVTNDYVVLTIDELPVDGISFPAAPSALRGAGYYVAAYLNGLRLSDTEWNYNYATGTKSITFNGSDDITLVSGDKVMVEVRKIN